MTGKPRPGERDLVSSAARQPPHRDVPHPDVTHPAVADRDAFAPRDPERDDDSPPPAMVSGGAPQVRAPRRRTRFTGPFSRAARGLVGRGQGPARGIEAVRQWGQAHPGAGRLLGDAALVIAFFSRLPVWGVPAERKLSQAVWVLPPSAIVIAGPAALVLVLAAILGLGALASAVLAVAALVVTTGALHEDGLADTADGFFGSATRERRLEIMADSRIGTYGTLALVSAILLKVALLAELPTSTAVAALIAAAVASRTVALYPWTGLPAAREGLAAAMGRPSAATFRIACVFGLILTLALVAPFTALGALTGLVLCVMSAIGVTRLAARLIGGHTGDVIGATVVVADLAFLAGVTIWAAS